MKTEAEQGSQPSQSTGKPEIRIWTDGSCWPNPGGPGGWACILEYGKVRKELSGHMPSTTNNRAEVTALIEALKTLKKPCLVTWTTDSEYAITCLNQKSLKRWKKAKNKDLIEELLLLIQIGSHEIFPVWVRGHEGHPENERCDQLALEARTKIIQLKAAYRISGFPHSSTHRFTNAAPSASGNLARPMTAMACSASGCFR